MEAAKERTSGRDFFRPSLHLFYLSDQVRRKLNNVRHCEKFLFPLLFTVFLLLLLFMIEDKSFPSLVRRFSALFLLLVEHNNITNERSVNVAKINLHSNANHTGDSLVMQKIFLFSPINVKDVKIGVEEGALEWSNIKQISQSIRFFVVMFIVNQTTKRKENPFLLWRMWSSPDGRTSFSPLDILSSSDLVVVIVVV